MTHGRSNVIVPGVLVAIAALGLLACQGSGTRRYDLTGQIVALDAERLEITVAHDAVPGFMDAMTMPFRVGGSTPFRGLAVGDVIRGRLVVIGDDGILEAVEKVGSRPLVRPAVSASLSVEALLLEGDVVPDVELTDQHGRRRALRGTPPTAIVLTFVYTRCPFATFCPLMDRQFTALQTRLLADTRLSGRVHLLSLSLDPVHDTPDVLRRHAGRLGARPEVWSFLTGDEARVRTLASRFGVSADRDGQDPAVVVHGLATVVIDREGTVRRIYRGGEWQPADIVETLLSTAPGAARAHAR